MSPETVGLVPPGIVSFRRPRPIQQPRHDLTEDRERRGGRRAEFDPGRAGELLPTTAIMFPPAAGPFDGLSEFTVGAGAAQIAIDPMTPPPVLAAFTLHEVLLTTNAPAAFWTTGASTDVMGGPGANTPPPITRLPLGQVADTTPAAELWATARCSRRSCWTRTRHTW